MKKEENKQFGFENMFQEMMQVSQKMTESYFKSIPNMMHTNKDVTDAIMSLTSKIFTNPGEMAKVQARYMDLMKQQMELIQGTMSRGKDGNGYEPVISPAKDDKRFRAEEWSEYPYYFDMIKQNYLLTSKFMVDVVEDVTVEEDTKKKLRFYTSMFLDSIAPSNFVATNPEVLKLVKETNGQCLIDGFQNLMTDIKNGRITQTDTKAFEVGKNLALAKGDVIYQDKIMQLIRYSPVTKDVYEIPTLIIPPWINRYYILDLEPKNSFVQFCLDKGITTFMISWVVPKGELGNLSFDDYAEGAIKSMEIMRELTGAKKVNAFGYCLGGTLLSGVMAILKTQKKEIIETGTLLATMADFSDIGALGAIVDEPLVDKVSKDLEGGKILGGRDMTNAFNIIRANDLIWSYVVNNYMKGKTPTPFSILYWTNDNTNLPGNMYSYYLKNIVIGNKLIEKDALTILGTPVDLKKVTNPVYVVGLREDHITPCKTVYYATHLFGGEVEFVLGESGHVAGAINPPSRNKYGYSIEGKQGGDVVEWEKSAKYCEGSWWIHWGEWISKRAGKLVAAPTENGSKKYPVLEAAPGSYVVEPMD